MKNLIDVKDTFLRQIELDEKQQDSLKNALNQDNSTDVWKSFANHIQADLAAGYRVILIKTENSANNYFALCADTVWKSRGKGYS